MGAVLRANQQQLQDNAVAAWDKGARCVMPVLATGGGKTVTMAKTAKDRCPGRGIVQAHRAELVGQLALAWAREGIPHDIVASPGVRRQIIDAQLDELGRTCYDPRADWSVESVDTAIKRDPRPGISWVFQDEGHHVLRSNKWGKALETYPDARWLLPTATPGRADGRGLGAHADGWVNAMVLGQSLAQQMAEGFLVTYDILHPTAADLDLQGLEVGANGEFNQQEVAKRVKKSTRIVGDAVKHYQDHAAGRLCIVFAVDIEHAKTLLQAYLAAGIPTELVTGKNLDSERLGAMKRFKNRQTLVLINVDLFGEGTDVPGVEVVQMCRPTASFPLFSQQVGRMLRLDIDGTLMRMWDSLPIPTRLDFIARSRKPKALLIDHVGNIFREFKIGDLTYSGPPEGFVDWSMDGNTRRAVSGSIPMRTCLGCFQPYERIYPACPRCGKRAPEPAERSTPAHVDGDLTMFDPAKLAEIRARVAQINGPIRIPQGLDPIATAGAIKQQRATAQHQQQLLDAIAYWAGMPEQRAQTDQVNYRKFYFLFGVDVATAQTLAPAAADALRGKIDIACFGVTQQ